MKDTLRLELTQCWSLCFGKFILIVLTLNYHIDLLFPFISSVVLLTSPPEIINHFLSRKFSLFFKKNSNYNCMASYHFSPFTLHLVNLRFSPHPFFFSLKKHFLKDLNRISSYKCNTICFYIHFLKNILLAYTFQ